MNFKETVENQDSKPNSLDQKVNFNRDLFRKELESLSLGEFTFRITIDELVDQIPSVEDSKSIPNLIKYKNKDYSLYIQKDTDKEEYHEYRFFLYNEEEKFNTFLAGNPHVAGWVGQGGFTFEVNDSKYHSEDHWGVSIAEELKGSGLADVLYDLKCQVDDQLEFEHTSGDDLRFLTFYIRKGYVPYSLIKHDPVREEIINNDILDKIILEIKESRRNKNQSRDTDYALRLKLDPKEAVKIYDRIKTM
ncbi:MAG: hypothetical protein KBC22_00075 [Candidatus Pacebacteria bacterium]|nr:hypothetical protein [Candidatus Paceibacterota bacterium]